MGEAHHQGLHNEPHSGQRECAFVSIIFKMFIKSVIWAIVYQRATPSQVDTVESREDLNLEVKHLQRTDIKVIIWLEHKFKFQIQIA